MLIYEKDNKLNINFENNVEETPDLQIGKSEGKTEILVDGQPGGSGGGVEPVIVTMTMTSETEGTWSGATWEELVNAYYHGCAFALDSDSGAVLSINGLLTFENGAAVGINSYTVDVLSQGVTKTSVTFGNDNTAGIDQSMYPSSIIPPIIDKNNISYINKKKG